MRLHRLLVIPVFFVFFAFLGSYGTSAQTLHSESTEVVPGTVARLREQFSSRGVVRAQRIPSATTVPRGAKPSRSQSLKPLKLKVWFPMPEIMMDRANG